MGTHVDQSRSQLVDHYDLSRVGKRLGRRTLVHGCWRSLIVTLLLAGAATRSRASCNQIPGTTNTFRGSRGALDRPFAGPGDLLEVQLIPACDAASPGISKDAAENVVTVVFTPPHGPRNVVVLAADCTAIETARRSCADRPEVANVVCIESSLSLQTPDTATDSVHLRFRFPDTDALVDLPGDDRTLSGPATIAVSRRAAALPCDLAIHSCTAHTDLVACIDTIFSADGTCGTTPNETFSHFTALPPPNNYAALCINPSPPCTGQAAEIRIAVDAAGNLLAPMDWRGILVAQAVPIARLLRGSTSIAAFPDRDAPIRIPSTAFVHSYAPEGGLLPPVFEPQADPTATQELTLFGSADAPRSVLQLLRRSPTTQTCLGGMDAGMPCVGESDECGGGSCGSSTCSGGAHNGQPCTTDHDCPDSECGPALFDFTTRLVDDVGPVIIPREGMGVCQDTGLRCVQPSDCDAAPCVAYRFAANDPVALEALIESPDLFVTVVPEAIDAHDLNGDGDETDFVLLLADRRTGLRRVLASADKPGRAVTRINQPPFTFSAVAVEADIVAFLEAEPLQGNEDANDDGDRVDTILRVYRNRGTPAEELTTGLNLAVDAAPVINGRSLVISDGLVFFRTSEAANARHRVTRVSAGVDGDSQHPAISADGVQVGFESTASTLTPAVTTGVGAGGGPAPFTSFLYDRRRATTTAVVLDSDLLPAAAPTLSPSLSADGRYVAVSAVDTGGNAQIFVHDRDADSNGELDEVGGTATALMSVNRRGEIGPGSSISPRISADGRYVAFPSKAWNIAEPPQNENATRYLVVIHDRDADGNRIFDEPTGTDTLRVGFRRDGILVTGSDLPQAPALSADGRLIAFATNTSDLFFRPGTMEPGDRNEWCPSFVGTGMSFSCLDIYVRDLSSLDSIRASVGSLGEESDNLSLIPALSADGRYVAFLSAAGNLVPGDTNGAPDIFVHDRQTGTTTRVSLSSVGAQANDLTVGRSLAISADGRYVAFESLASNLVPDDTNARCDNDLDGVANDNCGDVFLHDRLTGFTRRVSVAADGSQADGASGYPSHSADGNVIAFESTASNLAPGPSAALKHIVVVDPDPADGNHDLTKDGDVADTVLEVLDTHDPAYAIVPLGPADAVAVAGRRAAFLMPEAALNPVERPRGTDLNGDGDVQDQVVSLYDQATGGVRSLGLAATDIRLSNRGLAVLVPEASQGNADLNADGDTNDAVVQLAMAPAFDVWINIGQAADAIEVNDAVVAFITPEAAGGVDLNGDGDIDDRVLQLYDLTDGTLIQPGQAATELVLGDSLVAFRTPEAAQGGRDLNGDGDTADSVLQIYDVPQRRLINTGQAAIPCPLEACDPRVPYRVFTDTVKFLTLEADQNEDLDGDGDRSDLVLQTFNVRLAVAASDTGPARLRRAAGGKRVADPLTTVGAVSAGICTNTGHACATKADCGADGRCYVPPGGCTLELGLPCDTTELVNTCGAGRFCVPTAEPGHGTCHLQQGPCATDADCTAPARCADAGQAFQRLVGPLNTSTPGTQVFVGAGRCVEDLGPCVPGNPSCPERADCTPVNGSTGSRCERQQAPCRKDSDCGGTATCREELIVAAAADSDADGIADPFDNCSRVANVDQADANANGVGDACERVGPPATPTRLPSAHAASNGGCTLRDPGDRAPRGMFLVLLTAPLLWRKLRGGRGVASNRSHRHAMTRSTAVGGAVLLLPLTSASAVRGQPAPPDANGICRGDCDHSGAVTIDKLLAMVGIAEGTLPLTACAAGDSDGDGQITIDDLLLAVDRALAGCPPIGHDIAAGSAQSVAAALSYLPALPLAVSAAVAGANTPAMCPDGGHFTNSCDDSTPGRIRVPIHSTNCRFHDIEGPLRADGTVTISGRGQCPNVLFPAHIDFNFALTTAIGGTDDAPRVEAHFDFDAILESFTLGSPPCRTRGGHIIFDGPARLRSADGYEQTLDFHHLDTAIVLDDFREEPACDPGLMTFTVNGSIQLVNGEPSLAIANDVALRNLSVVVHRSAEAPTVELNGQIDTACLGGWATITTVVPLQLPFGESCFTDGVLTIDSPRLRTQLRFGAGGSVEVEDTMGDGTPLRYLSCHAVPRQECR